MIKNHFYENLFKISIPIILQHFMSAGLSLIDNIMVGQLGDNAIAAVGLANQVYFFLILFLLAVSSGASMFASQFWGKNDIKNIRRILGLSLLLGVLASVLFFLVSFIFSKNIMFIFLSEPEVVMYGGEYLRIVSFSFILYAVTTCYSSILRSTERVNLPMVANIIGIICNTTLNYIMIFGKFGFPALGVKGAAIATVISRMIELLIIIVTVYTHKWPSSAKIKEMLDIHLSLVKSYFTQSGALIIKDVMWAIGMTLYRIIYSRMGTAIIAAVNITNVIIYLSNVFFIGIANGGQIIIGNQIGANDKEKAFSYAIRFLKLTLLSGFMIGLIMILSRNIILLPYNVSTDVLDASKKILLIYGLAILFYVYNMVSVVGIMRSGGDTKFCIIMDTIAVYLIGLPLAFFTGLVLKMPIQWVFLIITFQELFKTILLTHRIFSKKWIINLVHDAE